MLLFPLFHSTAHISSWKEFKTNVECASVEVKKQLTVAILEIIYTAKQKEIAKIAKKRKKKKVEPLISCEKNQKITKTDWYRRWSKRFTFAELSWMFLQYISAMCLYMLYICFFPHWKTINSQESICQQLLLLIFKSLHSAIQPYFRLYYLLISSFALPFQHEIQWIIDENWWGLRLLWESLNPDTEWTQPTNEASFQNKRKNNECASQQRYLQPNQAKPAADIWACTQNTTRGDEKRGEKITRDSFMLQRILGIV